MKEILIRLQARTPGFFRKLRNIALLIATACTSASVFYSQLPAIVTGHVPQSLVQTIATAGFVASFIAQLTRDDLNKK